MTVWDILFLSLLGGLMLVACWIELRADQAEDRTKRRRHWPANIGLAVFNTLLAASIPISAYGAALFAEARGIGLLAWLEAPVWLVFAVTVAALSLASYAVHVASHHVPLLWRLHQVHHSDVVIDGSTALRHHPVEAIIGALVYALVAVALGISPEAVIALSVVDSIFAILTHGSWRLPPRIEAAMNQIFITPALHNVHHSDFVEETNSNFGVTFSIWDRLFGTFLAEPKRRAEDFSFGLGQVP